MVADYALCTALGPDVGTTWSGLVRGTCAIRGNERFQARAPNIIWPAAVCAGVGYSSSSMVMQMLSPVLGSLRGRLPPGALLLLATTVGEIDRLEENQIRGADETGAGRLDGLLRTVSTMLGVSRPGAIVSCACASSSMAMALGAGLIRSGRETDVIVVACDAVTEFVLAGFHSLAALSLEPARPFDRQRQGLSIGEAAGWCWLRGETSGGAPPPRGRLLGWSCRADAHHMTAPAPDGRGLVDAVQHSLALAGLRAADLGAICAHGTGTRYNDEMEVKAFARVPGAATDCPIFAIKGHIGHTMGAAGLAEAIVALETSRQGCAPPTVGCRTPEPENAPITRACTAISKPAILTTNSGFGGVNTALIMDAGTAVPGPGNGTSDPAPPRVALIGLGWATPDELGFVQASGSIRMPHPQTGNPEPFFEGGYKNWGRMSPVAKRLAYPVELGLRQLDGDRAMRESRAWGIIGLSATGCHDDNRAFFRDYLVNGRALARGGLFVHTLPSTPVAEASIHYGLRGPVFHLVDPTVDFSRSVDWACSIIECADATNMIIASLLDELILCAFLGQASTGEHAGAMGWADEVAGVIHGGDPADWLARFLGAKPDTEHTL